MTSLVSLPTDILLVILSYFQHDKRQLCHLALTTRQFGALTSQLLVRHPDLLVSSRKDPAAKSLELFLRSINKRPSLASWTSGVRITWSGLSSRVDNLINDLLARLPNLRELALIAGASDKRFKVTFLDRNPLHLLRKVALQDRWVTTTDLARYILLPDVRTLIVPYLQDTAAPKLPEQTVRGSAPLLELELGSSHLAPLVLRELLTLPRALQQLTCGVPGVELSSISIVSVRMRERMTPAEIGRCLEPVKATLAGLTLQEGPEVQWPGHDGSRMDLQRFMSLRTLYCPAGCLFATKEPSPSRQGLYEVLPPTLQELHVLFDFEWTALQHGGDERDQLEREREQLGWLWELLSMKKRHLPELALVWIEERIKKPRGFAYDRGVYDPLPPLAEALRASGVEVRIWLRMPKATRSSYRSNALA